MADLQVDIVTPERIVFSGMASEIRVPGHFGEFGVLPEHANFLSVLRAGIASLKTEGGSKRFVIGRGFAEAGPDRVVVLTDSCEDASTIDKDAAAKRLEDAERVLATTEAGSDDRMSAEQEAELARAMLGA